MRRHTLGLVLTALAAALFGTLGVFGKGAAAVDLSVTTLLTSRFVIATAVIWGVAIVGGRVESPRVAGPSVGLGVVYAAMSLAYFESLAWLSAGVALVVAGGRMRVGASGISSNRLSPPGPTTRSRTDETAGRAAYKRVISIAAIPVSDRPRPSGMTPEDTTPGEEQSDVSLPAMPSETAVALVRRVGARLGRYALD
jgi:hypothetical protein